ncbi:MAG TPA: long-chain fatty acid--CoA ligase [Solirubrobacterales bacterium]|jgi:long-chain acyl-CoA synthetase|nr:long-chain fatty acid--CoA ligase [Solirubrobacterales bacterium]
MESATAEKAATEVATGSKTLADLFPLAVRKHGPNRAVLYKDDSGQWVPKTYEQVGEIVKGLSLGLMDLGIEKGDKVSLLANTRPEWTYFDFAALSAGATVVPIYQTNSPGECQYVLENSDAVAVVVEDESQLEKVRAVRDQCPKLKHVILMEGTAGDAISMDDLAARGAAGSDSDWEDRWTSVTSDDICTFIYTSGTTGPPKGCVISHGNYRSMLDMVHEANVLGDDELTYLFLPLAHSFALLIQLGSFDLGATLAYWERDPLKIVPNLSEIRPTYFPSVPRIFEKIYTAATANAEKEGGLKQAIFDWAVGVGKKVRDKERAGQSVNPLLKAQHDLADRLVLAKIRQLFGGNLKLAVTGAAPINPDILRFFDAAGVLVVEGWGMTETSTAATISRPEAFKFGTVGKPFSQCDVKIADDGEILVKGPNIFQGYYKNEEATRETIVDGWLHTGDIGEVDTDGYLKITGRKKDIIITAGGKNITPANLEAEIKQSPYVSQVVVIGDRRPFLTALVTLDMEEVAKLAQEKGWQSDPAEIAQNAEMRALLQEHIDKVNERFARVEQVKKFAILPKDLSQEGGELTPTLKVKRNVVADKYEQDIEALYA